MPPDDRKADDLQSPSVRYNRPPTVQHACRTGLGDAISKERLFGLTGPAENHGDDVEEVYDYLDSMPTYSRAKGLYKYP